jgi:hypothetical protein
MSIPELLRGCLGQLRKGRRTQRAQRCHPASRGSLGRIGARLGSRSRAGPLQLWVAPVPTVPFANNDGWPLRLTASHSSGKSRGHSALRFAGPTQEFTRVCAGWKEGRGESGVGGPGLAAGGSLIPADSRIQMDGSCHLPASRVTPPPRYNPRQLRFMDGPSLPPHSLSIIHGLPGRGSERGVP